MVRQLNNMQALAPIIAAANSVYVSGCAAEIPALAEALTGLSSGAVVSGVFLPGLNTLNYSATTKARVQSYFMTPALRSGHVDYCPWRYRDIVRYYRPPQDVAICMLSPANAQGLCSYGVTSDFAPMVLPQARIKVGVINTQMPFVEGGLSIAASDLDVIVTIDTPLLEVAAGRNDALSDTIAAYIAPYVDDGASLQLGLGSIPGAVAAAISDRRNIKVRSGLIDQSIVALEQAGVLCGDTPILGGVALGDTALYQHLHHNSRYSFQAVPTTHNIEAIAATKHFVAVNGALEVDLFGQVNSHVLPSGFMSGPGGLPEFVEGALSADGGHSIIALNASAKGGTVSKIVPQLSGGQPSVAAVNADKVVTEFGVAQLRGKSVSERIKAMIAIADPAHRDQLQALSKQYC